jgi:hypothetical protein
MTLDQRWRVAAGALSAPNEVNSIHVGNIFAYAHLFVPSQNSEVHIVCVE